VVVYLIFIYTNAIGLG